MIGAGDVVCSAHQLNFLPGVSVIERLAQADVFIWLDETQFERHSFVNRNRLTPDGAWLTIPVSASDHYAPINRVRITDATGRQREKVARALELELGARAAPFTEELRRPYDLLAGLNQALIEQLLRELDIDVRQRYQSHLDRAHAIPAVSDDEASLEPVRERFAAMAAQLGATVWLTGPGGHHPGERVFAEHGIRVEAFEWERGRPNPSAITLIPRMERVPA